MRRITKITPLLALGSVVACDRADMPRGYQGISDSLPTGSFVFSRALTEREIQTLATRRLSP